MGFNLFKGKERRTENQQSSPLLAMPMFANQERYDLEKIIDSLKKILASNHY
jgi:hypothetical protein